MAAFFSGLLPLGITMVAVSPKLRAANATLWPWLPRVALMAPVTSGRRRRSRSMVSNPPRALKAPMGVWFSCLTQTSAPTENAGAIIPH